MFHSLNPNTSEDQRLHKENTSYLGAVSQISMSLPSVKHPVSKQQKEQCAAGMEGFRVWSLPGSQWPLHLLVTKRLELFH